MVQPEVERFRVALALHDEGVALMRLNLQRRNPDASEEEIAELLRAWLQSRPGAPHGDAAGRPGRRWS